MSGCGKMRIGVLGWYGHGNIGDEAMLEGLQYLLERYFGCHDFLVMTSSETPTIPMFNPSSANSCDLFLLGGGELISPRRIWLDTGDWQRQVTVPKAIVGCGVNGKKLDHRVWKGLEDFKYIGLRDDTACGFLSRSGQLRSRIHLMLDPSLILSSKYRIVWNAKNRVAGVVPTEKKIATRGEGILSTNIIEESKRQLKHELHQDGMREVKLFAFGEEDNGDLETCRRLAEYLRPDFGVTISRPVEVIDALHGLAECSKIYAYRLHGMLLAYSLGVPFTYYRYHLKVKRNYDTIKTMRFPDALIRMARAWQDMKKILE